MLGVDLPLAAASRMTSLSLSTISLRELTVRRSTSSTAAAAAAAAEPVSHGDRNAEVVLECRDVYPQDGRVPARARRRDTHDVCRVTRCGIGYLLEPLVANQPSAWQLHVKESPGSGSTTWSRDSVCAHKCA
jgi:hypothetical protein